jgi:hypothetical protein
LLQTPTTVQTDEPPEKMRARAERNGYKNGTKFGSLTSQIKYDERVKRMWGLPTPTASMREDFERVEQLKAKGATTIYSRANNPDGTGRHHGLLTYLGFYDLLPTVQTTDWNTPLTAEQKSNYEKRYEGKGVVPSCTYQLRQMAADGLLPNPNGETDVESAGKTSRLSPLFTEEMMGFPLMWTALPFLSENGEPKPSKPTATPSSPK